MYLESAFGCSPLIKLVVSGLVANPVTFGMMEVASLAKVGSWKVGVV